MSLGELNIRVSGDIANFSASMEKAISQADKAHRRINRSMGKISRLGKDMFKSFSVPAALGFAGVIKESKDFQSEMVNVSRTTQLEGKALKDYGKQIVRLAKTDLPVGIDKLTQISEAAGSVGVTGSKDLGLFTDAIAKLGASTDLAGNEGAISLKRLLTSTGETNKGVTGLANVLSRLEDITGGSASEIVNLAQNIGQSAGMFGLASHEAAAWASAMTTAGINAEKGGTQIGMLGVAMQKAIDQGGAKLEKFAHLSGMTASEFSKAFGEDASNTMISFIGGLKSLEGTGQSVSGVMGELGLNNARMLQVIPTLAKNYSLLTTHMGIASDELKTQTYLNAQAEKAFSTTDASINRFRAALSGLGIAIGNSGVLEFFTNIVGKLTSFVSALSDTNPAILKLIATITGILAVGGPLLILISQIGFAFVSLSKFTSLLAAGVTSLVGATTLLKGTLAVLGGPAGLAVLALASLSMASTDAEKQGQRLQASLNQLGLNGLDPATAKTEALRVEMTELAVESERANFATINKSLKKAQKEIDEARAAMARFREFLQQDNLSNDNIRGYNEEIVKLDKNIAGFELIQRKLNVQLETSKIKTDELKGSVSGLQVKTENANNSIIDYGNSIKKILNSEEERKRKIDELTAALAGQYKGNKLLQTELDKLTGKTKQFAVAENLASKEAKRLEGVIRDLERAGQDFEKNIPLKSTERFTEALKQVRLEAGESSRALTNFNKELEDGTIKSVEEARALANKLGLDLKQLGLDSQTSTELMTQGWKKFQDGVQDAFFNAFRSGENFFKSLKNLAFDILAQIAAKIATTFVLDKLGLGGGSGGGLSGNLSGLFGGGGGGSGGNSGSQLLTTAVSNGVKSGLQGTQLGSSLGLGSGSGTLLGNGINTLFGGSSGSTIVGNGINSLGSLFGFGSAATGAGVFGASAAAAGGFAAGSAGATALAATQGLAATASAQLAAINALPVTLSGVGSAAGTATAGTAVAGTTAAGVGTTGSAGAAGGLNLGAAGMWAAIAIAASKVLNPVLEKKLGEDRYTLLGDFDGYAEGGVGGLVKEVAKNDLYRQNPINVLKDSLKVLGLGGARSFEQIMKEDYIPDLFGNTQEGFSAVGADGVSTGFNGGNTGVFGANWGIKGSGLTAQALADGGENGNGGFFTGAQSSIDGFAELLKQNGIQADSAHGGLRVLSETHTVEDIKALWQAYADGLTEAVSHLEVFKTAQENNLIEPSNLFFENFAVGFGQSAFEARESLLSIDAAFDSLQESGMESQAALFQSISDHYGIAIEDAKYFVKASGVSADQWVANFESASGEALKKILDFGADGRTEFEKLATSATRSSNVIKVDFGRTFRTISNDGAASALAVTDSYTQNLDQLKGYLNGINLGTAVGAIKVSGTAANAARVAPPKLSVGTPFVHQSGLAELHFGERVMTAQENREYSQQKGGRNDPMLNSLQRELREIKLAIQNGTSVSQQNTKTVTGELAKGRRGGVSSARKQANG